MRPTLVLLAVLLCLGGLVRLQAADNQAVAIKDENAADRAYIQKAESDWAESTVTNDDKLLERILADDYVGVEIDGKHVTKGDAIREYRTQRSEFVSNHLNQVEVRFYGDAAVAQGDENWKLRDGTTNKFVWTDTWIRRKGTWRIVASEDLIPTEITKKY